MTHRFVRRICGGSLDVFHNLSGVRNPAAAHVSPLLVHDRDDAQVPASAAHALAAATLGPATVLETTGFGHSRILAAGPVLDAVTAFITAPDAGAHPPVTAASLDEMSQTAP